MPIGLFSRLLDLAANALPSQCAVCRSWCSATVCGDCTARFAPEQHRCISCAHPLSGAATHCGACLQHGSSLDACYAAVDYDYPWDGLLAQLKFGRGTRLGGVSGANPAAARCMAALMHQRSAIHQALAQADWAVPVPLSTLRQRERGFNQALQITQHLLHPEAGHAWVSPKSQAPSIIRARLRADLLVRTRETAAQMGLGRSERQLNMLNAFAVEPALAAQVQGARLVLVDDVTTTTATLGSAAAALRRAGAAHVTGVVFARTPASGYNRGLC
jgi:predicted amidophosphoribosyltransferase